MPEGDTLFRIAARIRPAFVGREVLELRLPRSPANTEPVTGSLIRDVQTHGKNLFIHFSSEHVLHTHLKMNGIWHVYPDGAPYRRAPSLLVVSLRIAGFEAACFHAPVVRLLTSSGFARDPLLRALGPDILHSTLDEEAIVRGLTQAGKRSLGEALLDQRIMAGVGNVYKSEALFTRKLDPFAPVSAFSEVELRDLVRYLAAIMQKNVRVLANGSSPGSHYRYQRTTRSGCEVGKGPISVYGRMGEPCFDCDSAIARAYQGALSRSTYYCPTCQPARTA